MRVTDDIIIISKCMQEHGLTKSILHAHFLLLLSIYQYGVLLTTAGCLLTEMTQISQ